MNDAALKAIREMATTGDTLGALKAQAAAQVAQYPQYAKHFERARLVRVTADIRTKMGLAFAKNEIALLTREGRGVHTLWSMRNEIDTSVPADKVSFHG